MRKTFVAVLFVFVFIGFISADCTIRFMNIGDKESYFFGIVSDKQNIKGTMIIKDYPNVGYKTITKEYKVKSGSYYICGSNDNEHWGYNNNTTLFEDNTEYFIIRTKPGEGYLVISNKK